MKLVKHIFDLGYFVRSVQVQMRFGDLSRSPLRLLRVELDREAVECDWIARAADEWDSGVPRRAGEVNVTKQALQDAMAVRKLLFSALPGVNAALLRVFRQTAGGELELIITGTVARDQQPVRHVASLVMRAKLLGFQFWLEDGILESLKPEECAMSF